MSFFEKKIGGKRLYDGKILSLDLDEVLLSNGAKAYREIVRHAGGAAVLYTENGKILFVKQFRYAYGKELYEIPAGKLNHGEDPMCAAARELEEEAGLKAELVPYLQIYPTPGYTDEIIYIYLAKNAIQVEQKLDEGEFLNVEYISVDKAVDMIENGQICDGKTIAAIYKFIATLDKN